MTRQFVDRECTVAVFTQLDPMEIQNLLTPYSLGVMTEACAIGQGMENSNYLIRCEQDNKQQQYVLSLLEELSFEQTQFHVQLLANLSTSSVPVAQLVADHQGRFIQTVQGKPALLSHFIHGQHIHAMPSIAQCETIGQALADLHLAAGFISKAYHGTRDNAWLEHCVYQASSLIDTEDKTAVANVLTQYLSIQQQELPHGMIHGDLFRDNAFFIDDQLTGIIDFYSAGIGFLIYDLAIVVNDWCSTAQRKISQEHYFALLNAYRNKRPWTDNEALCWPLMMQTAAMRFWLSRLLSQQYTKNHSDIIINSKDPDEFKQLFYWLANQDGSNKAVMGG